MSFNIMKTMYDTHGQKQHILLTDGLSEILDYSDVNEAMSMVQILNENSDRRTEYELRPTHKQQNMDRYWSMRSGMVETKTDAYPNDTTWTNKQLKDKALRQHMDESDVAYNKAKFPTDSTSASNDTSWNNTTDTTSASNIDPQQHGKDNANANGKAIYGTSMNADEEAEIQRMIDLLGAGMDEDNDLPC